MIRSPVKPVNDALTIPGSRAEIDEGQEPMTTEQTDVSHLGDDDATAGVTTAVESERATGVLKGPPPRGKPGTAPVIASQGDAGVPSAPRVNGQIAGKSPSPSKTTEHTVEVSPLRPIKRANKRSRTVLEASSDLMADARMDEKRARLGGPAPGFVPTSERGRVVWEEALAGRQRLFALLEQESKRMATYRRQEFRAIVDSIFETLINVVGEERNAVKPAESTREKAANILPPSKPGKPKAPSAKKAKTSHPSANIDSANERDEGKTALAPQVERPREKKQGAPPTWTEVVKRKNFRPSTTNVPAKKGPAATGRPSPPLPRPTPSTGYSDAAKRRIKRSDALTLLVKPVGETPEGAVPDNQRFWSVANPRANGLRIARTRTAASGAIVVEAADKATYDRLMASEVVKGAGFAVSEPPGRNPRVRVRDVPSDLSPEDLVACVASQNPTVLAEAAAVGTGGLKPLFRTGPRRATLVDWVIEATPVVFRALKKARTVYVNWSACRVQEYSHVTRCYKCCAFGHAEKSCRGQTTCAHCGEVGHSLSACPKTSAKPRCINCVRSRRPAEHKATAVTCPANRRAAERTSLRTKYD